MRVLIAEDDPTSRIVLEATLKKAGYEVVATCDGNEAWRALQDENAPRLVILDRMMPGLDGIEICRRARKRPADIPPYIILLTALLQKEDIAAGLNAGADDYVTKPFNKNELCARLDVGRRMLQLQSALLDRVAELNETLKQVKTLRGIIPICMHCKKIRDDKGYWRQVEHYVHEHSEANFSHSLCEECLARLYPEVDGQTMAAALDDKPEE